ncbi:phage tail family protein [Oceanobacillus kimchii]|uniref:phage tail family protein n=1 Tax=Oceanobacillus kimchii TaxID=746691 RepID=UPI003C7627F9
MRRLTYENARGERIVFYLSPILIESLTGIGEVDADLQGQKSPYQDGETHLDVILQPRFIDLEGSILKTDLKEMKAYRKYILRVCNPKLGLGKITLELDGDIKEIFGVLDGTPAFPERGRDVWQKFLITWKCPSPYWRDPNQTSESLQSYVGNFTLPFTLPFELGVSGSHTTLFNNGDIPASVRIDIQGPVTNPQILNKTNGQWLKVNRSIARNEILHIDTTEGRKRVEIYRNGRVYDVFGYLDYDSEWIKLDTGANEIEHIADAGDSNSLVAITWNSMYVGI